MQFDAVPPITPLVAHIISQLPDQQTAHAAIPAEIQRLRQCITQFMQIGEGVERWRGILEAHSRRSGGAMNGQTD